MTTKNFLLNEHNFILLVVIHLNQKIALPKFLQATETRGAFFN